MNKPCKLFLIIITTMALSACSSDRAQQGKLFENTNAGTVYKKPDDNKTNEIISKDLTSQAKGLANKRQYREAELLLTRAIHTDTENIEAYKSLAVVQRAISTDAITSTNIMTAGQAVDRAKHTIRQLYSVSMDPKAPMVDPAVLTNEDKANAEMANRVRIAADTYGRMETDKAKACAEIAFHSSWNVLALGVRKIKNDRDKVVEGLKHLKNVFEISVWASDETRSSAINVYLKCKDLVNPEEWEGLNLRAGLYEDKGSPQVKPVE